MDEYPSVSCRRVSANDLDLFVDCRVGVSVGVDCNVYTLGLIDLPYYILDSSIATHVLDGDLWSRKSN